MAKIRVNRKQKYILALMIISLCLIGILNSCGNVTRNIGYGLSELEIEERYRKAELMYNAILDGKMEGSHDNWNKLIKQLNDIIEHHPKSQVADDALYSLGLCYIWSEGNKKDSLKKAIKAFDKLTYYYPKSELVSDAYYWRAYAYLGLEDYKRAILEFERFKTKFPKSPLYADAEYQINECRIKVGEKKEPVIVKDTDTTSQKKAKSEKNVEEKTNDEKKEQNVKNEEKKVITDITKPPELTPDVKPPTKNDQPPLKKDEVKISRLSVKEIRYSSSPEYTRVVIDLSQSAKYDTLKLSDPERICINIQNAVLSTSKQDIIVDDAFIKKIRSAQFDLETVRVVLDLKAIKNYKVFDLKDPFRIVIDVFGQQNQNLNQPSGATFPQKNKEPSVTSIPKNQSPNLVKQLGLKVRTIVIDPGHGGKDPGAVSRSGLYEKHFVLDISKRLRDLLKSKGIYEVYMTRETDVYIPLRERTAFANSVGADVFISVHINASQDPSARGIETYYLSLASDEEARLTAALENASSDMGIKDLGTLLSRVLRNTKVDESRHLAGVMQSHLTRIKNTVSRGVKRAPFIVLVGADAPSILVELGFMSNDQDEKLLQTENYKDDLAKALMNGIEEYVKVINSSG